ncbi:MAG: exodeoxyribonuclease VII small subunit [Nitrospirae bacterium]|nr:exodeoxyribonuclease VII small subunit [Nitrospirota bacterium]
MRFEDGLKRLEQIVDDLEKGDLPLEKSIELFEEGKKLSDFCKKKLDEAQFKVETLMKNGRGESKAVPFEENEGSPEKPARGQKATKGNDDIPF